MMLVDINLSLLGIKEFEFIAFILEDKNGEQLFRQDTNYRDVHKWEKTRVKIDQSLVEKSHSVILYPMYTTGWGSAVTIPSNIYFSSAPANLPAVCNTKKIEAFSFVCTHEVVEEAMLMLKTLRQHHSEPVVGIVDDESYFRLGNLYSDLILHKRANKADLAKANNRLNGKYDDLTKFHRKDCILKKMEVMRLSLNDFNNTFFLDSDIIVCDKLQENFTRDVCLSLHNHNAPDMDRRVGIYNAGYIFTDNKDFPDWWEHHYLNKSLFYEQECMNRIPEYFNTEVFTKNHNFGFWRNDVEWTHTGPQINFHIKSFHHHMTDIFDNKQPECLKIRNTQLRSYIRGLINES